MSIDKNKKILVTGGTGMLGAHLLHYLIKKGYTNVRATKRATSSLILTEPINHLIEWVEGDLLDTFFVFDSMEDVQQVYHCAAMVSFDGRDRDKMIRSNVDSTTNLVNAALEEEIEKFVHVSSVAAIGRRKKMPTITENEKWERSPFNSNYGISKHLSEMEVWRGMTEGLNVAIVNPSIIIGAGYWNKGSSRLFQKYANGFPFYSLGGTGFVDVRDVVLFITKLMNSDIVGERYILNSENRSYRDYFNAITEATQSKKPHIKVNSLIQALAWRIEWLRARLTGAKSVVTKETAHNSARTWTFDNSKSLIAFKDFSYIPLDETIQETAALYAKTKEQGHGLLSFK